VLLRALSSLLELPPYTFKIPSVKEIKIENLFNLSSRSENEGVWSLVLAVAVVVVIVVFVVVVPVVTVVVVPTVLLCW